MDNIDERIYINKLMESNSNAITVESSIKFEEFIKMLLKSNILIFTSES